MTPYYERSGVSLWQGDCRAVLASLPDQSVQCVVTSPPYWGLRDYGVDGQIGLESTPAAFVAEMVAVFREVRRVLRDDGTLWLNLGDAYSSSGKGAVGSFDSERPGWELVRGKRTERGQGRWGGGNIDCAGLPAKNLLGMPWRVAFALQDDGWILRSDIVWAKPNPMPESVSDRPTKSHEYIFLFAKSARYFYDAEAIKEDVTGNAHPRGNGQNPKRMIAPDGVRSNATFAAAELVSSRSKRTVWTVATNPYSEAHFATFPPKLIEPCVLAGCPAGGVVLDPFAGAGTTLLVAKNLGRAAVGIELSPIYCELIVNRLRQDVLALEVPA
jgi:site-specific DNA-methyltransferase (adenine-specific)